ncbi:MAG: alpha/beta fold hydrolase [Patescibacteria group bacterium UBA2163]
MSTYAALEIDYARVQQHSETEVLIQRTAFTKETSYRCSFITLKCNETDEGTSILSPGAKETPIFMNAYRALLPRGASSLHRSPDGRYIAFYIPATQARGAHTFGVMDTTDLSIYTKTEPVAYWDLLSEGLLRYYHFSPDSKTLLYLSDTKDHSTLYEVNMTQLGLKGTELPSTRLFSREYSVVDLVWKDNDTIFYIANRDNPYAWALYELTLSTYNLRKIADNVSYADNLWLKGEKLLFAQNDAQGLRPALYNTRTETLEYFQLPKWDTVTTQGQVVETLTEGLTGIFLLEESGQSDTLVIWLHGGPYRQAAEEYHPYWSYGGYDWMLEKLRRADVGILKLDYPGSFGFGRLFAESITGGIGTIDAEKSAAAIANFAARNNYEKVYVVGNSYGGYLSLKLLVDNPNLIDGALSINGVMDWMTLLENLGNSIFNVQFHGTANDTNRELYRTASIYNYADNITDQKVVLVHGENDTTIPYEQSRGLATFLSYTGVPVNLVTMPGEDHVFKKPMSFETLCKTLFQFTDRSTTKSCEL